MKYCGANPAAEQYHAVLIVSINILTIVAKITDRPEFWTRKRNLMAFSGEKALRDASALRERQHYPDYGLSRREDFRMMDERPDSGGAHEG